MEPVHRRDVIFADSILRHAFNRGHKLDEAARLTGQQDDLKNLDLANGQCRNATVMQNVTFSTQGLPFGLSKKAAAMQLSSSQAVISGVVAMVLATLLTGL